MQQVLDLFKGTGSPKAVLEIATSTKKDGCAIEIESYNKTNALAYAHFYIGMYNEVLAEYETARQHFQAADEIKNPDFMECLMQMHYSLFCHRYPPAFYSINPAKEIPPKIIHGGWQASKGHLIQCKPDSNAFDAVWNLLQVINSGICTFDCGDIYTGVEELYGQMIRAHRSRGGLREDISIHTKLVPDLCAIQEHSVDREYIESVLRRTLNRLGTKYMDLVQFHWWDTSVSGYVAALGVLNDLVGRGLVKKIGITNFDINTTKILLNAGIPIMSTQVKQQNISIHLSII